MKQLSRFGFGILPLAVCAAFALPASATPTGTLEIFGCGGASVTVTATAIDFSKTATADPGTPGCITTGGATNITSSFGLLTGTPTITGSILDILGSPVIPGFMTFVEPASGSGPGGTLSFNLAGVGPGSPSVPCTAGNSSSGCSILAGSPFTLFMVQGTNNTTVILPAFGTITDATGTSNWSGQFSANFAGQTPVQLQTTFNGTGKLAATTFSGSFVLAAAAVPEPGTIGSVGIGLALMGIGLARRRTNA